MKIFAVVLGIQVLTGCASGSFAPLPRQGEALAVVWNQLYGEAGEAPPVEWMDGSVTAVGETDGMTLPGWKVQVMLYRTTEIKDGVAIVHDFSESSLSHELMHYRTYLRTGDVDAAHWRGDWKLAGDEAFLALWHEGL